MPRERVGDGGAERVDVLVRPLHGIGIHPGQPGTPADRIAEVTTDVPEQRDGVEVVAVLARAGKRVAIAGFGAELEEQVGRREPLHLQAVLPELSPEERLVRERLVDEIPGVRVHLVQVADAGEEAAALDREPGRQRRGAEERFLDLEFTLAGECCGQAAGEVGIDARRERDLRLAEAEAALARADFVAGRQEAGDRGSRRGSATGWRRCR